MTRLPSVVLIGPAGAGKTAVGQVLSAGLGVEFLDGDSLHPAANIGKMRRGEPLTDHDRWPWLDAIAARLRENAARRAPLVLACSALKRRYRDRLREADPNLRFALLNAPRVVLEARVLSRGGHFMPAALVADQCDQLELPDRDERALVLDATASLDSLADRLQSWLHMTDSPGGKP